jgi:exopolysaccharide biosynthesis polyprenyl glycosylphosphotransferase
MVRRAAIAGRVEATTDLVSAWPEVARETTVPPVHLDDLPVVIDLTTENPRIEFDARPMLTSGAALLSAPRWRVNAKRLIDVCGAILALVASMPIFAVVAAAVKLSSPGPVIFSQARVGKDGRVFRFYKFRSMRMNAESEREILKKYNESTGPVFKIKDDPRLTPVGRFIRRTSIDELPQLWNVLRGDMSLVGPRPPIPHEVDMYSAWENQRLSVKPGLTCIWQVSGRCEVDFETWVQMDIDYIENWSLLFDLNLLARTIPAVLLGRGAY